MKTFLGVMVIIVALCLGIQGGVARANTVEVNLVGIGDLGISAFQLFFYPPGTGTLDYPVETDYRDFIMDFSYEWGLQAKKNFWELLSLISTNERGTEDELDDVDYAIGIGGSANLLNATLKLNEGLLVRMISQDTEFGINPDDPRNKFFDFNNNEVALLRLTEQWDASGNQVLNVSMVPIPSAFLLLGSGLFGLVALRRKRS